MSSYSKNIVCYGDYWRQANIFKITCKQNRKDINDACYVVHSCCYVVHSCSPEVLDDGHGCSKAVKPDGTQLSHCHHGIYGLTRLCSVGDQSSKHCLQKLRESGDVTNSDSVPAPETDGNTVISTEKKELIFMLHLLFILMSFTKHLLVVFHFHHSYKSLYNQA